MKKKFLYLLFIAGFMCSSCNDWLSTGTITEIEGPDMLNTENGYKSVLTGVYLQSGEQSLYGANTSWYFLDAIAYPYKAESGWRYYIKHNGYLNTTVSTITDAIWNKMYNNIANINYALRYIDKKKELFDEKSYQIIKGEMLGLRGFFHFDLLRMYGVGNLQNREGIEEKLTIPYVIDFSKELAEQVSYKTAIEKILDDLDAAEKLLAAADPIYKGNANVDYSDINYDDFFSNRTLHMNYYAVKATEARVYMWEGSQASLAKAEAAAQEVIDNSGSNWADIESLSNTDLSKRDYTFTSEYIFGLYVYNLASIVNNALSAETTNTDACQIESYTVENGIFTTTEYDSDWNPIPTEDVSDIRYARLLENGNDVYYPVKLRQMTDSYSLFTKRIPLIRLPEMYFIKAECQAKAGNNEEALKTIDIVRHHRGLTSSLSADKDALTVLTSEYMKEFIMEGQFFFYCKRNGLESVNDSYDSPIVSFSDDIYLIPFPTAELEQNRIQE